jgi:hypothetical protein
MKYLITESQINKAVFRYIMDLNLQTVYSPSNISFVYSLDDSHAVMRYGRGSGRLIISKDFRDNISDFFSIDEDDAELILANFVEENSSAKHIEPWDIVSYGGMIADANLSM